MTTLFSRLAVAIALATVGLAAVRTASADDLTPVQQLLETKKCPGCNLMGAHLADADLVGADLGDANLYLADLTNADLSGANLANANFSKANLRGAKGAVLANAITDDHTTCPDGSAGPCK